MLRYVTICIYHTRMKNGRTNLCLFCTQTNGRGCVCGSIFHPWADAPFPLSLPFFFSHRKVYLLTPRTLYMTRFLTILLCVSTQRVFREFKLFLLFLLLCCSELIYISLSTWQGSCQFFLSL